ncbi:uncharacterized protein LOC143216420 [Lasioglossum baleicum]|uniref:uncharacterized protein LOC143216420 n=1 Tax=Lasioglossum baleicum TaxID=434251 RepID=UPI003FCCC70E
MSAERVWLLSFLLVVSSFRVLSVDVRCPRLQNYTVTRMERYLEPVTVDTYTWCLQIPPRCLKTRTEMRERYQIKTENRTRTVNECCEGYQLQISPNGGDKTECRPFCENCFFGVCVSPRNCQCYPGFRGENCVCGEGTWGPECKEKCNCAEGASCDPVNGNCSRCPAGLRGRRCNESCAEGRWGANCAFPCDCGDNRCDAETGVCVVSRAHPEETVEPANITLPGDREESTSPTETTETIETATEALDEASVATDHLPKITSPETTPDQPKTTTQTTADGSSSTDRPVIVLVSVPEGRRNLGKDKFAMKNPFLGHRDVEENHLHEMPPLKSDYVKNIHKDMMHLPSIPLDIALIVVASIISLGLTSVAVVMVLHMRSKLLESARVSIYEVEKTKGQDNTGTIDKRSPSLVNTLPRSPVREIPAFFTSTPEAGAILTIPGIDPASNYANGAATIGLRISGTLRDFLQDDHYDRPPSTQIRLQTFGCETTPEHIYDEIPLQSSPMCPRKSVTGVPIDRGSTRAGRAAGSSDLAQLIR